MNLEFFVYITVTWLVRDLPISAALSFPIYWRSRGRIKWSIWDAAPLVVPYLVWAILFASNHEGKALGNIFEMFILALATPLVPAYRAAVFRSHPRLFTALGTLILTLLGVFLWATAPEIPAEVPQVTVGGHDHGIG